MDLNNFRNLMAAAVISCSFLPITSYAHEPVDPQHAIPIEMLDSRLANLTGIHVQVTDQGVEVKGKLKRKGHKNKSLRGHIDVEMVGLNGQVLASKRLAVSHRTGSAKHDHSRDFAAVLPAVEGKEYSVRVRHNVGMSDHK